MRSEPTSLARRLDAADLLADLWRTGLRHGVTPNDWRSCVDLAGACLDAIDFAAAAVAMSTQPTGSPESSSCTGLPARADDVG